MARNKSEKPNAWQSEMIAFALECEKEGFRNGVGLDKKLIEMLSEQALDRWFYNMSWRDACEKVFTHYGRVPGVASVSRAAG